MVDLLCLALDVLVHAADPVGKWSDRFAVMKPVYPAGYPAAERAKIAAVEKGRMAPVLKPNHTTTMRNAGLGMTGMTDAVGTWTQSGANIRLLQKGRADYQGAIVLDPSGRRMSLTLGQSKAQIVFTRA